MSEVHGGGVEVTIGSAAAKSNYIQWALYFVPTFVFQQLNSNQQIKFRESYTFLTVWKDWLTPFFACVIWLMSCPAKHMQWFLTSIHFFIWKAYYFTTPLCPYCLWDATIVRCGGPMDGMARLNPKYTLERIERIKFTSFIAFFKLLFLRLGMPFAKKYAWHSVQNM